jgi:hypothetical protein
MPAGEVFVSADAWLTTPRKAKAVNFISAIEGAAAVLGMLVCIGCAVFGSMAITTGAPKLWKLLAIPNFIFWFACDLMIAAALVG